MTRAYYADKQIAAGDAVDTNVKPGKLFMIDEPITGKPSTSSPTPHTKIIEQIWSLESSLSTIQGYTEESRLTRMYLVGQIESLKWASKLWDV